MAKLYSTDLAAVIEEVAYQTRRAVRKVSDDDVLILEMPATIDFQAEVIIRKDDLARTRLSTRNPTTTTSTAGTSVDTESRSGIDQITDETETMEYTRDGGETSSELGADEGSQLGGQQGTEGQAGGETETYTYE